jgi:hypothetical protein
MTPCHASRIVGAGPHIVQSSGPKFRVLGKAADFPARYDRNGLRDSYFRGYRGTSQHIQ